MYIQTYIYTYIQCTNIHLYLHTQSLSCTLSTHTHILVMNFIYLFTLFVIEGGVRVSFMANNFCFFICLFEYVEGNDFPDNNSGTEF